MRQPAAAAIAIALAIGQVDDLTGGHVVDLGAILGGRDHSSVVNACRRAADMRDSDPAFRCLTDRLVRHFRDLQED